MRATYRISYQKLSEDGLLPALCTGVKAGKSCRVFVYAALYDPSLTVICVEVDQKAVAARLETLYAGMDLLRLRSITRTVT